MNSLLIEKSKEIRRYTLESIAHLGVGHIGGSLSIVEVLTVLYYKHMRVDPKNPKLEGRDRLVVSKGHAGPGVYAALASKGYFPVELLFTLNQFGTNLPSHCDMNKTPGIDMTTGSLGQGFSASVGVAIGSKIKKDGAYIYAIIGDGESQEGQIWEAAMLAAHKKLDNLIAFTDFNKMQIDGNVEDINEAGDIVGKWVSFGWHTQRIDGHDMDAIDQAIIKAKNNPGKPHMIILDTIKGKGAKFAEDAGSACHNMPVTKDMIKDVIEGLK
ncbi:MAG TPA: transketolase [Bacilli bacterium]|nr:transketolase [Bacilli bacterium]